MKKYQTVLIVLWLVTVIMVIVNLLAWALSSKEIYANIVIIGCIINVILTIAIKYSERIHPVK